MSASPPQNLVLALYPFFRGFAFVFLEGPDSPYEWGIKECKGHRRLEKAMEEIKKLIDRHRPEVIVVEEKGNARRAVRIRRLYRMIAHLAKVEYIDLYRVTKREVAACFAEAGAKTKQEIAHVVALHIPAFAHRLPRPRQPWQSEDPRQSLFDAAALALAYYRKDSDPPEGE